MKVRGNEKDGGSMRFCPRCKVPPAGRSANLVISGGLGISAAALGRATEFGHEYLIFVTENLQDENAKLGSCSFPTSSAAP